ncbi:MAG: hypothetical protein ACRCWM_12825 [Sarcina sp.]
MNKEKITKFMSNPFTITFSIVIIVFLIVMFNILTAEKPFDSITKMVDEINFVNHKKLNIENPTSNNYISEFTKNSSDLKGIKTDISSLEIPNDFVKHKESLLDIIDKNIVFYDNMIYFLENIESENLIEHSNNIALAKNDFEKSALKAKELKLPINLNFENETLLSKFSSYSNELIKIYRDKNIHTNQTSTFKTSIDSIYTKFGPLNEDLFVIINLVKKDGRDLTAVLESINEKIELYKELNLELHSLSIPDGYNKLFTALKNIFKKYDIYIHTMRDYVIHEINNSSTKDHLKNAEKTYDDVNKAIIDYLEITTKFQ